MLAWCFFLIVILTSIWSCTLTSQLQAHRILGLKRTTLALCCLQMSLLPLTDTILETSSNATPKDIDPTENPSGLFDPRHGSRVPTLCPVLTNLRSLPVRINYERLPRRSPSPLGPSLTHFHNFTCDNRRIALPPLGFHPSFDGEFATGQLGEGSRPQQ